MVVFLAGFIRNSTRSAISISIHLYLCHKSIFNPWRFSLSLSLSLSLWLHYQYLKCVYLILIYWKWNSTQLSGTKPIILFSSKEVSELLWCFALSWLTIFAYRYRIHPWSRFFLRKDCCAVCTGSIPSPNNYNSHPYS